MAFLTEDDKQRIRDAIAAAERKTSGEFVAVVTEASDHYLFFPTLWAAVISLLVPGIVLALAASVALVYVYIIQLGVFAAAEALFLWPPLKIKLVPKAIRHAYASRAAHEQFYLHEIHRTREHSGVLLFVSVTERYVELVADHGIHTNVGEQHWQDIVNEFVDAVRAGKVALGFLGAIRMVGDAMAAHYPRREDDVNELPNRLIEL